MLEMFPAGYYFKTIQFVYGLFIYLPLNCKNSCIMVSLILYKQNHTKLN